MKTIISLTFCIIFFTTLTLYSQNKINSIELLQKGVKTYDFYNTLQVLRENFADYQDDYIEQSTYFQALATVFTLNGMYDSALVAWDKVNSRGVLKQQNAADKIATINADSIFKGLIAVDAKEYILQQAKANRILCFNEAHTYARNRMFVKQVLNELSKEGYRYLALEALVYDTSWLSYGNSPNRDVFSYVDKGFYTKESCYAELLREAIRCGYQIIGYEPSERGPRDSLEAANVMKILEQDTNAKIVVLAGHGHISKVLPESFFNYLSKMTTLPLLSIGQTSLRERATPRYETAEYLAILERYKPRDYIILVDSSNSKPWYPDRSSDFDVIYPRSYYINGRLDWLYDNGNRKAVKLKDIKKNGIVKVYYANEYEEMASLKATSNIPKKYVPIDQIVVEDIAANKEYFAVLPTGKFMVLCCDTEENIYSKYTLNVKKWL